MLLTFNKKLHCIFKPETVTMLHIRCINHCAQHNQKKQEEDYGTIMEFDYRGKDGYTTHTL